MRIVTLVVAVVIVGLAAWGLQLGASPVALAQQTCPAGQTYCPSGAYAGQCRANTATCTGGSYTACGGCVCPAGQVLCGTTCQAPKRCPDTNRSTADQCAASDAASCGACASGYTLDSGTCVLQAPVILAPLNPQERSSDKSAINVVQGGSGLLFNLQAQSGTNTATRKRVLAVDKTGLMVGFDPNTAKNGADFRNEDGTFIAGGQNLIYGIAKAVGLEPALDALLLLQTKEADGNTVDRVRVTGAGDLTASGNVRGSQLCIGGDCKSSWSSVAPAGVLLQATTPGEQQTGNFSVSGTGRVGTLIASGAGTLGSLTIGSGGAVNLQGAMTSNASWISGGATGTTPPALRFVADGDIVLIPKNTGTGRGLTVWQGASDPTIASYAKLWHDGTNTYLGDTTNDTTQALRISGPDAGVPGTATVGSLTLATGGTMNLQEGDIVRADTIGAGTTPSARPFIDFSDGYLTVAPSNAAWGIVLKNSDFNVPGYAHLWHNGTKVILNDENSNASQGIQLDGNNLAVSGTLDVAAGIQAGSGNVNIIDSTGKIPAISSTYLANLSGANLTSLNASNLGSGTVPSARLPSGLLQNPIDGGASALGPWLTIQGGANVVENIALRLYDAGTANGNMSTLEFAHNTGSGPGMLAYIKSVNVGANASGGAALKLVTASNNAGAFNADQLVLRPDGNVRVSNDLSLGGGDILIDPGEHLNITAPGGDAHLGGLARLRVGGLAITDNLSAIVPTRGISVSSQGTATFDGPAAFNNSATFGSSVTVDGQSVLRGRSVVNSTCSTVSCSATCSSGWTVMSGGCSTGDGSIRRSYPASSTQWTCERTSSANTVTAYAVCAKL